MKVYLASRYSRRLCGYREQLESIGVEVTSRWLDGMHQIDAEGNPIGERGERLVEVDTHGDLVGVPRRVAAMRARFANEDFADVMRASLLVAFTEPPRTTSTNRGGRHVELGIALGAMKRVWVVGHRENIFCWHGNVRFFEAWEQAIDSLRAEVSHAAH